MSYFLNTLNLSNINVIWIIFASYLVIGFPGQWDKKGK
jgi:hypothetical protein